jgi:hypothetical protein
MTAADLDTAITEALKAYKAATTNAEREHWLTVLNGLQQQKERAAK